MFKTDKIEKIVKYALISGFLKRDTAPLSLMIVAPPESNKTSMLKQFEKVKGLKYTIDLSSKPLMDFLKDAVKEKYYHIVVPDFVKVVRHNYNTVNSVVATLNALIEEGIQRSMFYGQEISLPKNVRCGMITSITPELYRQQFKLWNDIGFLSRFITISYEYSEETRNEIMKLISGNGEMSLDETLTKLKKSGNKKDISISNDVSEGIRLYVSELVNRLRTFHVYVSKGNAKYKLKFDIQGFRLLKQMRLLAKSIAFDKGLDIVNYECLGELKDLMEFFTLPDNPKVI